MTKKLYPDKYPDKPTGEKRDNLSTEVYLAERAARYGRHSTMGKTFTSGRMNLYKVLDEFMRRTFFPNSDHIATYPYNSGKSAVASSILNTMEHKTFVIDRRNTPLHPIQVWPNFIDETNVKGAKEWMTKKET